MIHRKKKAALPSRRAILQGGSVVGAGMLTAGLIWALLISPFDPPVGGLRLTVAVVALAVFWGGALGLMLADKVGYRIGGAQIMAVSAAAILIALAGGGMAWFVALFGWAVATGMTVWGLRIIKGIIARRLGEERKP